VRLSRGRWDHPNQIAFDFEAVELPSSLTAFFDDEDDDQDEWSAAAPVRIVVPAAGLKPPKTAAPRSIFDVAGSDLPRTRLRSAECPIQRPRKVVELADGHRRHIALSPQDTEEWKEKEAARRARQKPPKPTKGAKTMGRKLAELIGEGRD
jgi:hypothetical protein